MNRLKDKLLYGLISGLGLDREHLPVEEGGSHWDMDVSNDRAWPVVRASFARAL
jgi:hypothetical protein